MKNVLIMISLLTFYASAIGQNTEIVESAFKSGNAGLLSSQLAKDVELCIGDNVEFYTNKETVAALNDWLKRHTPTEFEGKIVGGSTVKYYNGKLKTKDGQYRVMVYYNSGARDYEIDEIRIVQK